MLGVQENGPPEDGPSIDRWLFAAVGLLRAYPNNPLFTNLIDPFHEVLWTIVMGGFGGRLADTL